MPRRNDRGFLMGAWSPSDREFWEATFSDDPIDRARSIYALNESFNGDKKLQQSGATHRNERQAVEFFMGCLQRDAPQELKKPFPMRFTLENIKLLIHDLSDTNIAKSIGDILMRIYTALQMLDPGPRSRYRWLKTMSEQLPGRYSPSQRPRPTWASDDIIDKMVDEMAALEQIILQMSSNFATQDVSLILRYRSLLMTAAIAADPVRLTNFASHRIDISLYKASGQYNSYFPAEKGKTGLEPHSGRFKSKLTHCFDFYFDRVRPKIARVIDTDAVFVNRDGAALAPVGVHYILTMTTLAVLGERFTAHLFRHAMVDTAVRKGHAIAMARDAVGHKDNSSTTEGVYQGVQFDEGRLRISANMAAAIPRN